MKKYDVVVLTDERYTAPVNPGMYEKNILIEDQLVAEALQRKKLAVTRKAWTDTEFDWSSARAVLFRTTWDYDVRLQEFKSWISKISKHTLLLNSLDLIEWNINKKYLIELRNKDVNTIHTTYLQAEAALNLNEIFSVYGCKEAVLKPAVGAAGRNIFRINSSETEIFQSQFDELIRTEDYLLQPFQESVIEQGEWSYMIFGNTYSHAVTKRAKNGEFRVQDDFGGKVSLYEASQYEIDFALKAKAACPGNPAYTRVDAVRDNDGKLAVSEIEFIEPELWFRLKPEAAGFLANEIHKQLKNAANN